MTQSHKPIRLDAHQLRQASEVMSRAFHNDPAWQYLIPDDARRLRLLPSFSSIVIRYSLLYGQVYTTPDLEGIACWLPPENTTPLFSRLVRIGIRHAHLGFELGWMGLRRYMLMEAHDATLHKQAVPGPHWYLWMLGVDPPYQGQGIGSMLIQPVLAYAGVLPCYLETSNEKNLSFYRQHGFKVVNDGEVPQSHLHVWAMVRRPHDRLNS
jgi:ribosomal protein S18 acetylase RimI-like enzyme